MLNLWSILGAWQTTPQPKLPKSYKNYNVRYRFVCKYQGFMFLVELLQDKEKTDDVCWFIKPKTSKIKKNTIVFSDEIKIDRYWQRDIYNISIPNDTLRQLFQTFRENQIFYSDDLTGTDFKQAIDFVIKK